MTMRLKCNAVVGVSGARNSSNGMACSSSITTAPQCPKAKDAGLKNSGSTCHLSTSYGLALVCRRWTEHVRPEVVPAYARCGLNCDASFRRYTATVVPPSNGWRLNSEDGRQAELATRLLNCSIKGCHVHESISPQLTLDCKPCANRIALAFH